MAAADADRYQGFERPLLFEAFADRCYADDGSLVLRPSGHGALLDNLAEIGGDIVFIKNIDNVTIAGQTAPSPITIVGNTVQITSSGGVSFRAHRTGAASSAVTSNRPRPRSARTV